MDFSKGDEPMLSKSVYPFTVGKMECIAFLDTLEQYDVMDILANVDSDDVGPALAKYQLKKNGQFSSPYTCLLIKTGSQRELVDTGKGDLWEPGGRLLDLLLEAGVGPKDIDLVIISHAHGDHVGGNFDKDGKVVYPNAQWVIAREEWQFWSNLENLKSFPPFYLDVVKKKLLPLSDRFRLVDGETEIVPGIFTIPLAGHTPGHLVVAVRSEGQELLYIGDALLHPLQVEHPEWCASHWADWDWDGVVSSQRELCGRAASAHSLMLAFDFDPFPSLGHIERAGDAWRWVPIKAV